MTETCWIARKGSDRLEAMVFPGGERLIVANMERDCRETYLLHNEGGDLVYRWERDTPGLREAMARAQDASSQRTWDYMQKGWRYDEDVAKLKAEIKRLKKALKEK